MAGDPFGLLLRQRIVFLGGEVNDFSADAVISQLLLLDSQAPNKVYNPPHPKTGLSLHGQLASLVFVEYRMQWFGSFG